MSLTLLIECESLLYLLPLQLNMEMLLTFQMWKKINQSSFTVVFCNRSLAGVAAEIQLL